MEVRHESSLCRKNLDGLSPVAFKKNTLRSYESVITPFCQDHGNLELEELTVDLVQVFLESITNGRKSQTLKIRFTLLTSFFNFVHNNLSLDSQNPLQFRHPPAFILSKPSTYVVNTYTKRFTVHVMVYG